METTEVARDSAGESVTREIMEALSREAEQVVANAIRLAREEAEAEAKKMLQQYEQKTRQIALKIKEDTKSRATQVADKVREAILLKIERASADIMSEAIAESTGKIEELGWEGEAVAEEKAEQPSNVASKAQTDASKDEVDAGDKKNAGSKTAPIVGNDGIEANDVIEGFDQWLAD